MSQEDYSRFQIWIESMSDEEYASWLEDDASDKQEEKAISFRPEPSDDMEQELERQQEGEIPESPQGEVSVQRSGIRGFFRRLFGR